MINIKWSSVDTFFLTHDQLVTSLIFTKWDKTIQLKNLEYEKIHGVACFSSIHGYKSSNSTC